jgi:hypothetical protein
VAQCKLVKKALGLRVKREYRVLSHLDNSSYFELMTMATAEGLWDYHVLNADWGYITDDDRFVIQLLGNWVDPKRKYDHVDVMQ